MKKEIEKIAKVCYNAIQTYSETNEKWENAEEWEKESTIKGVEFKLSNPEATAESQHEAWLQYKINNGWIYGKTKDTKKKTHPCILPFNKLSKFDQKKDILFCAIIDALYDTKEIKNRLGRL